MRNLLSLSLGAAVLVTACQPQTEPTVVEHRPTARFAMHVNPTANTATIEILRDAVSTKVNGLHVPAPFDNDLVTGTGAADTFEAVTTNPLLPGAGGCGATENCFTVQLRSFAAGRTLTDVLMRIDSTSPNTGHDPVNPGTLPPGAGISAGLGVYNFGDVAPLGTSGLVDVRLTALSLAPYTVFGSFFEQFVAPPGGSPATFSPRTSPANVMAGCDDCGQGPFALPFNFTHCGNTYTQVFVSSNGFISFSGNGLNIFTPLPIPTAGAPNDWVGLWTDWRTDGAGRWSQEVQGVAPNREFVAEWLNMTMFGRSVFNNTMQIVLREDTQTAEIHVTNVLTNSTTSPTGTEGLENIDGTVGLAFPGRNNVNLAFANDGASFFCP